MIRWSYAFIDRPMERFVEAGEFWAAATGTRLSARRGDNGEFATLLPPEGDACLKLQGVGGGAGPGDGGGAHLDLDVEDVPATVELARGLGATVVAPHPDWAVLRSPGGQPVCLNPFEADRYGDGPGRPPVVVQPDGAGSRLDQVCVDVAPAAYDAEVAFWRALTGWRPRPGEHVEFTGLEPPAELPVQILVQRLDAGRPGCAHLDLACSDAEAVRRRHEQLGARLVAAYPGWLVMRDPAGGTYCLTRRDPETGGRALA